MKEVNYSNDENSVEQPDPLMEVNAYLEAKTLLNEEIPTVQNLAEQLGIGSGDLEKWVNTDPEFQQSLEQLKQYQDESLTSKDPWHNRVDVGFVRLLLTQTKKRHSKDE